MQPGRVRKKGKRLQREEKSERSGGRAGSREEMEGRYKRRKAVMVIIFRRPTRPYDHSFIRSLEPIYYDQGLLGAGRRQMQLTD